MPPPHEQAILIVPHPFDDWKQSFQGYQLDGLKKTACIHAENSQQKALLLKPLTDNGKIEFRYGKDDSSAPDWIWQTQSNRYTTASPELVQSALDLTCKCRDQMACVEALINHAAEMFGYGHPDERFNEGHELVPTLCGTTKGSCVDINTWLIAASRSLGIEVQYLAGYWFGPDRFETPDMHCWLVFRINNKPVFWDLAHHLKWNVEPLAPGLNPAGGRRVLMSAGRGLQFETPYGLVEISHFSEPHWVLPGGSHHKSNLRIHLTRDY